MPAVRSRTENWRRSLDQLCAKKGSIELALPQYVEGEIMPTEESSARNIVWRVRVLDMNEKEITIDQPSAFGQSFELQNGIDLVGIIVVGQNRWMFRTKLLGKTEQGNLRINAPQEVERCQRRQFYRVATVGLSLPTVQTFALTNIDSARDAEIATRDRILQQRTGDTVGRIGLTLSSDFDPTIPEVGPSVETLLLNLGGGGVGLLYRDEDASFGDAQRLLWLRIKLPPHLPYPLGVVGRVKHTHVDSMKRLYAGVQFEFGHHASYQRFVVDELCRYVAMAQRDQVERTNRLRA